MSTWPDPARGTLKPFPSAAESFTDPAEAQRVLAPLVSIDLSAANPQWSGWLPIVSPYEPAEGYVGEGSRDVHTYFARPNWIGFELHDDGRLDFKGDWRFFAINHSPSRGLNAHYEDQLTAFTTSRGIAREHGKLVSSRDLQYYSEQELLTKPHDWLVDVGDPQPYGANWQDPDLFKLGGLDTEGDDLDLGGMGGDDVHPLMPNGDRFHFVASVNAGHFLAHGASEVLAFFEPRSRTVLFTFEWD